MNAKALFDKIVKEITLPESTGEVQSMAFLIIEKLYGITYTQVLAKKEIANYDEGKINDCIRRINGAEPIQYILGEAWFFGRAFYVTNSVLIPRPETEQLVQEVINRCPRDRNVSIIDIGTGSGCIAITLAKELTNAHVLAVDISNDALLIAKRNAETLKANLHFMQLDVLNQSLPPGKIDILVSNPPYVRLSEKDSMLPNVVDNEPHLALFVPDSDALIFYKAIGLHAQKSLVQEGTIAVEINEALGASVCEIFKSVGFHKTVICKDLFGKDRMVIASR